MHPYTEDELQFTVNFVTCVLMLLLYFDCVQVLSYLFIYLFIYLW